MNRGNGAELEGRPRCRIGGPGDGRIAQADDPVERRFGWNRASIFVM
jgi:hypothetical protein